LSGRPARHRWEHPTRSLCRASTVVGGMTSIRTTNVLVTDSVGSTHVLARGGLEASEELRERHDLMVAAVVDVFGGEVVKSTGDGLLSVLPSADHAIRAASAIQEAAAAGDLVLRVGVSTGDAVHEAHDCFGEAVVVAFRLCDRCPAGSVLVDAATVTVRGRRRDAAVEPLGPVVLRGFDEPVEVWSMRLDDDRPPGPSETDLPVVGRDGEASRVATSWLPDSTTLIVIEGEPGIGKTHFAKGVAGPHARWVQFSSSDVDGFASWRAVLDAWAAELRPGVLAALGRSTVTVLGAVLPSVGARLPTEPYTVPDSERELVFDALGAVLELVGRDRVIVLDDVQWASATAEAFLRHVVTSTSGLRLLATCRHPVPTALRERADVTIELGGLDDAGLAAILHQRGVDLVTSDLAVARAGGNPLLALVAAGTVGAGGEDPVGAMFNGLPAAQRSTLAVAALIGRTIDLALLSEVVQQPLTVVADHVDLAVQQGLLTDQPRPAFVHDLVREAAEASVRGHRRVALHAIIAEALERRNEVVDMVPHVIAGLGALDPAGAVARFESGWIALVDRLAFEEAIGLAGQMWEAVAADPRCGPALEARILLRQAWGRQLLGDIEGIEGFALRAARRALDGDLPEMLAEAAITRAWYAPAGVPDRESVELLDAALARLPADRLAVRSRLLASRGLYLAIAESRGEEGRAATMEAVELARQCGDVLALGRVLQSRLYVLLADSDLRAQAAAIDELEALQPRLGWPVANEAVMTVQRHKGSLSLQLADRAGFDAALVGVERLAEQHNSWMLRPLGRLWRGLGALLDGDPDEAERMSSAVLSLTSDHNFVVSAGGLALSAHRWRGTLQSVAHGYVRLAEKLPGLTVVTSIAATVAALCGDAGRAAALVDDLLARRPVVSDDTLRAANLAFLTEACVLTSRTIPEEVVGALRPFAGQLLVTSWGVDVLGAADRFLAIAAATRGDPDEAAAAFTRAANLEAHVSEVLPLRTMVWRRALLDDVTCPADPPPLHGLELERNSLANVSRMRISGPAGSRPRTLAH
jgi:class 3 adenylate cyclase